MQEAGQVVVMTGDAVNHAVALKQADVGVAMGSGSEVTKQGGKLILTDDNFGTLAHAVRPRPRTSTDGFVLRQTGAE